MKTSVIHIKNMVCARCISSVQRIMNELGYQAKQIELGRVEFEDNQEIELEILSPALQQEGFKLIDDETSKTINAIKIQVIKQIYHHSGEKAQQNFSRLLEKEIGKNYSYISSLFSKTEGRTIEKYIIQQRIERVKELLVYDEKTISEIAWELGYSSSQYLSNQFKSVTGFTPSAFRDMIVQSRQSIDQI